MAHAPTARVTAQRVRDGEPAALAALIDRRGAAVLAYCHQVAPPGLEDDATADAFVRFRQEVVAHNDARTLDPEALLLRSTRRAAAARAPRVVPERGILARRLGSTCVLVPELLAARAEGELTAGDRLRLARHLERCELCREAEARFTAGEHAYHNAPAEPLETALADQLVAALRAAAPNAPEREAEVEPEVAEPVALAAAANGSVNGAAAVVSAVARAREPAGPPTLSWDPGDVAAAADAAGADDRRWPRTVVRVVAPTAVLGVAVITALAVAGVFGGGDGAGPAGAVETQGPLPPTMVRVLLRADTTPLPDRKAAPTPAAHRHSAESSTDTTPPATTPTPSSAPTSTAAVQPEPQLSASAQGRSDEAAPPPASQGGAKVPNDGGFQPGTTETPPPPAP